MALSPLGVLDLSLVTDQLIQMLTDCRDNSPLWKENGGDVDKFTIKISGSAPETVREAGGCQLSLYLFHVEQDKFLMNSPLSGKRPQTIPFQPLCLNLYYMLTAFSKENYVEEQQAMSIALRCFHQSPVVHTSVTLNLPPPSAVAEEFTLTMAVQSADEMARLWQSITSPMRLTSVYRVGVVLMTPPAVPALARRVDKFTLSADPTTLPYADSGQLIGTSRHVSYLAPDSTPANPESAEFDLSPATVAPDQFLTVYGAGLTHPTASRVFLLAEGQPEREITSWVVPPTNPHPPPATLPTDSKIVLHLPNSIGTPPAASPAPGIYQVRVGSDAGLGDPVSYRSNATPFSVAARIDIPTPPPNPPLLAPNSVLGLGFVPGRTEVLLDTVPLTESGGPPGNGEFVIGGGGSTIDFIPPASLPAGRYSVRVRVNQVESDPSWWVIKP